MSRLPQRVDPDRGPWPLHDAAASRALEAAALAACAPQALMEQAGLAVARLVLARFAHARRIEVWAGPGNNGGDGFVAARHLHGRGLAIEVRTVGDAARSPADARAAAHAAAAAGVPVRAWRADEAGAGSDRPGEGVGVPHDAPDPPDLVIDALLGLGAHRAPAGDLARAIAACNAQAARGVPVLAVDLPSGLGPDTGQPLGDAAVQARVTLALLTLKPGLFTGHGRDHAGEVWFDDLGVPGDAAAAGARLAAAPRPRAWAHATHKGVRGDLVVVGGAPGMVGAAWLAARAALAAGAGRVWTSVLDAAAPAFDATRPELMARSGWWRSPPQQLAGATVVCGCGGGDAVAAALPPLLAHAPRLVLDADALNAIAADTALQTLLRHRGGRGHATLLTPHPLEAARLLGGSAAAVQADRLAAARALAARCASAVLLKGSGSVSTAPGAPCVVNPTGNAALASPGTGDVLAGWAGGLWAQQPDAPAWQIGADAAWLHGRAADLHLAHGRSRPLRAADLIEALAALA